MEDAYEIEQRNQARLVLRSLALGLHPSTGKPLLHNELLHEPVVIRALILAIEALEHSDNLPSEKSDRPARAGQAWNAPEDEELRSEFGLRVPLDEICEVHQCTSGSIVSRLVRLKLVDEREDARRLLKQPLSQFDQARHEMERA